jgi:hypothetical protein
LKFQRKRFANRWTRPKLAFSRQPIVFIGLMLLVAIRAQNRIFVRVIRVGQRAPRQPAAGHDALRRLEIA